MRIKSFLSSKFLIVLIGFFICFVVMTLYISPPYFIDQADRQIYDIFLRAQDVSEASPTPAIIDIDEASLREFGQWPWPRHLIASILKISTESGAAAIGLDIMFAEPDRSSPLVLKKSLQDFFDINIEFSGLPAILEDNDKLFGNVLQTTPTVLGTYIQFDENYAKRHNMNELSEFINKSTTNDKTETQKNILPKNLVAPVGVMERMAANEVSAQAQLMHGSDMIFPVDEIIDKAPIAFLNVASDLDGIIRKIPLVMVVEGRYFFSLGLRSLMVGLGVRNILLENNEYGLCAIRMGKYRIPVSPNGVFHLPFRGPRGAYPYFSAKDILQGKIPPEELAGRILLLGTSAPGLLDIRATPFDPVYPGVESHATVIDAILSDRSISVPEWTPAAQLINILISAILATLIFGFAPAFVYLPSFAILCGASLWTSWHFFENKIFFSPQYSLIVLVTALIALLSIRFVVEVKQKSQLRKAFNKYISPEMVNRITDRGEAILAGEEREVTLIFTDIRGFTSFSEKLEPRQVVDILNRYFTPMTRLIQHSQGTVDKFIGDAIMAFWNAPLDVSAHELKAVRTALNMHKALELLNEKLAAEKNLSEKGITLNMGAGVHTGTVYVGNMGSEELLDYTCIGDNVNLCSRLEGMCSHYGVGAVVSEVTAKRCKELLELEKTVNPSLKEKKNKLDKREKILDNAYYHRKYHIEFILFDKVRVKGKNEAVELYMPIAEDVYEKRKVEFLDFEKARDMYAKGDFSSSIQLFEKLSEECQETKLYKIYSERCQAFIKNPVDIEKHLEKGVWNGVWVFESK